MIVVIYRLRADVEKIHTELSEQTKVALDLEAEVERLKGEAQIVDTELQFKNLVIKARNEKLSVYKEAMRLLDVAIDVFEINQDRERKDWCSVSNAWIDKANEICARLEER